MQSQKKYGVGISIFHWCSAVTTRWYSVRSWGKGGRGVQAKEQTSACPGHWWAGSCGMQLCKARAQQSWVIFMERLLQVAERSTPVRKQVGRHSRTPVWLHKERLTQTQRKMEANQRWKWREVTQEKQRGPTWPGRNGVCKAQLALNLV